MNQSSLCPTCGLTTLEQHPRQEDVLRCVNCKEWLTPLVPVMTHKLRHKATVLKHVFPDCYREVDGYWVWAPGSAAEMTRGSAWTERDLAVISDLLREANRLWDWQLKTDLGGMDD